MLRRKPRRRFERVVRLDRASGTHTSWASRFHRRGAHAFEAICCVMSFATFFQHAQRVLCQALLCTDICSRVGIRKFGNLSWAGGRTGLHVDLWLAG
eukprot:2058279-Pleurochrysis_carterae.AAC.2